MGKQNKQSMSFSGTVVDRGLRLRGLPYPATPIFLVVFLTAMVCGGPLSATEPVKNKRSAQPDRPSPRSATEGASLTLTWKNVPLQQAVTRLQKSTARHLMLDRRLDPGRKGSLDATEATLEQVLASIASQYGIGVVDLGKLVYLGPEQTCRDLRTLIALRETEIALLPKRQQAAFEKSAAISWARLAQPRKLIQEVVSGADKQLLHAERIPHDLWAAGELPAMSLTRQLTLLLAGFEATFSVSPAGDSIEIIPILQPPTIRRAYEIPPNRWSAVDQLRQTLPTATVTVDERTVTLDGRWEDHQQLQSLLTASPPPPRRPRRKLNHRQVFTLEVRDQPVGPLVEHLATKLKLQLDWDRAAIRAAEIRLMAPVSCSVEAANLDELLEAVLQPVGLRFQREGTRVRIFPSNP